MLIVLLVTPWPVDPVAWPLPQGDGSVPNLVEGVDDAAPVPAGAISTPADVSATSNTPTHGPRIPVFLFMPTPCLRSRPLPGPCSRQPLGNRRTGSRLPGTLATRRPEVSMLSMVANIATSEDGPG